ncbi:hypothetical protein Bca4012_085225 [Brassica carinata]
MLRITLQRFYAWIALIEETERIAQDCIAKIRKGEKDKTLCVYQRAVDELKFSVDFWSHCCAHVINTSNADIAFIRGLFERALAFVGTDYLSSPLWDKYLEYESKDWGRLAMIYTRIFENPIQGLDRYFDSFKGLAQALPLSELRSALAVAATSDAEGISEADPEELIKKYIGIIEAKSTKSKEFESKIIGFETAIGRRLSFHVQPLSVEERENWHNFLDFIESDGELPKVYHMYERCVVSCANYTDYWIRFVLSMKARGRMDLAKQVLARATTNIYLKRQPQIHLFAAEFKEQNEDITARHKLSKPLMHNHISGTLLMVNTRHTYHMLMHL